MKIQLTIDTADYDSAHGAQRLIEELTMARNHGEGITIRTAGRKTTVDVLDFQTIPSDRSAKIAEGHDVVPCNAEGKHLPSQRHTKAECPEAQA